MANYNTSANIVLTVNGKQAEKMMSTLEKDAKRLEKQIEKAASAGDKASMKKLQRELNTTKKAMDQLKGSAFNVEDVLNRLDKATPKELQQTLKQLQTQLNGIERGSAAWNAHAEKIKAVKAQLQSVNATLATQQSLWTRLNDWLNNAQTAILGVTAAVTGLTLAGRKAVNAYAEMDEELANTRKYTGMTEEEVVQLNEAFKKMDTRTSRAELNQLAQEAGRLGKNTLESVQGYVEAADIINVALVDLGSGATQTIAKLTNIFGVDDMLGTKDAMLAVGSAVNVLSQNCTASKPYLVEFAQRMAGIGSQAGMTIPQILAFGAVLDANGQKVEMSATAIQKVIMNLANKNHEFAATLGLDAAKLNETLKHSAKDGLLMFLEALQKMGQDVGFENATMTLAPAFKEMGLDAARVSQVLSTLAMHLDEVKWQLGEADKAFNEASSATHEYEIFNTTMQAQLDKARKRVSELAVELGEKLYPVMSHIYTSSGIFLRVLSKMVDFFIENKKEILTLTVALTAYNATMLIYNARTVLATTSTKLFKGALTMLKGVAPVVMAALTNAVQYFTNGLQVNYYMQERWRKSLQAMKFSNWTGLILAAASAVYLLASKWNESRKAAEEAKRKMEEYKKSLIDIDESTARYSANQIDRLDRLYKAATDETKSIEERKKATESLQKLYPSYFSQLSSEEIMVGRAKSAYDSLSESIKQAARTRAAASKIEENYVKLIELEEKQKAAQDENQKAWKEYSKAYKEAQKQSGSHVNIVGYTMGSSGSDRSGQYNLGKARDNAKAATANLKDLQAQAKATKEAIDELTKIAGDNINGNGAAEGGDITGDGGSNIPDEGVGDNSSSGDKFAKEKEWRDRQEALATIAYATGKTDFLTYTDEMNKILLDYYDKQLEHTDLSETERLQILARKYQEEKRQREEAAKRTQEEETQSYNNEKAQLIQLYADEVISKEAYDRKMEEAELRHLQRMVELTEEGSQERLAAEQKLNEKRIAQQQKHQKETEDLQKKFAKIQEQYFGLTPDQQKAKYDEEKAGLDEVYAYMKDAAGDNAEYLAELEDKYQKAKLVLMKKYNQEGADDTRNAGQKGMEDFLEWLSSEGGQAFMGTLETFTSSMSSIFSQVTSLLEANLEIQEAAIENRYDAEISKAEGNTYKEEKLEKEKEEEIAKAKNEANRKSFSMQVIQAVAQGAQAAINAYSSAAAVPLVGYILAPIAAAAALAATGIQIAAIKKQQQASEAQGYSEGGFTPAGRKDETVGVVHAGEWVASQKLVNNPRTRPLLDALDYAQRTNTIGSLTMGDVSRSITAPLIAAETSQQAVASQSTPPTVVVQQNSEYTATMHELVERLKQPFVTVNTVTGDHGIQQVEDEYNRLMRNKTPKSRR